MKSVVLEKPEFENRGESISQTILAIVVHQDSNAEKELSFFKPILLKKFSLSTATLEEEVKPEQK